MADYSQSEFLARLLADSFDAQPIPEGPHPVDDEELLAHWADDRLSDEQRTELLHHLSLCPECRETLNTVLDAGLLELPMLAPEDGDSTGDGAFGGTIVGSASLAEASTDQPAPQVRERHPSQPFFFKPIVWASAAAAVLLIAAGFYSWIGSHDQLSPQIAMLEQQLLQKGSTSLPSEQVLQEAENLLTNSKPDASQQERLRVVIERAAYQLAEQRLRAGAAHRTLELVERAARSGAASGRLTNLRLQAEQSFEQPLLLAMNDRLYQDAHYSLNGRNLGKSLPLSDEEITPTEQRWLRQYQNAIGEFPKSLELRLNYARLLLRLKRPLDAAQQLEAAIGIAPDNAVAHRALGASYFQQQRFEEALREFEQAANLDDSDLDTLTNLAIALERLGRHQEATPLWRKVAKQTDDEQLRATIASMLED